MNFALRIVFFSIAVPLVGVWGVMKITQFSYESTESTARWVARAEIREETKDLREEVKNLHVQVATANADIKKLNDEVKSLKALSVINWHQYQETRDLVTIFEEHNRHSVDDQVRRELDKMEARRAKGPTLDDLLNTVPNRRSN